MSELRIDLRKMAKKYDIPAYQLRSFIEDYYNKTVYRQNVTLSREEYRALREYFSEDTEMLAYLFYNRGKKSGRNYKNVVKLTRRGHAKYVYEWYRYTFMNGKLARIKIGEMSVSELEEKRIWKSSIDQTVIVLNHEGQFEAMAPLPNSLAKSA